MDASGARIGRVEAARAVAAPCLGCAVAGFMVGAAMAMHLAGVDDERARWMAGVALVVSAFAFYLAADATIGLSRRRRW